MASGVVNIEKVSHRQLSGDVLVRNVDITGWCGPGVRLGEKTHNGRLWGEVSGTTVTLYRSINTDGTFTAGEAVLTGTGAENALITLGEANGSGLSGHLRYTGSGKFDVIISYADEDDVLEKIPGENQQLVWQVIKNALAGPRRLQPLLEEAKIKIDERLIRDAQDTGRGTFVRASDGTVEASPFTVDLLGRYQLAIIAAPEQLKELQVWTLLKEACEKLIGSNEFAKTVSDRYTEIWHEHWTNLRLWIDADANLQQDGNRRVSPVTYKPNRR